ncbi:MULTISPECIES: OmpH family outer membrane protein [Salibacter]|uniref:OmpH family outer membrane protein n=1 Tax=Salibacter halophilus TaxID=1803916 RepID=A0A6N6M7S4_9FLAO|nr:MULTISPECIES: OmpH family outer membrane protein [Salibacter]KAB1065954.1 OmpH family outer membrane protein [Salibacter halophilus]MDR9399536.1 OmpH family outer membrane protein [Salibacter sp.]MDR9488450.1 OmpH family outer membrane protein [Salibacter sp.]
MKQQVSLIFSTIALLAAIVFGGLYLADVDPIVEEESGKKEKDSSKQSDPVVAIVNTDSLMKQYELAIELEGKLSKQQARFESRIKTKEGELMDDYEKLKRDAPTLGRFEGQARQQELQKREQKLYELQDNLSRSLAKAETEFTQRVTDSVTLYMDEISKQHNYKVVLSKSISSNILWSSEQVDITDQVIKGLNDRYDGEAELSNQQ